MSYLAVIEISKKQNYIFKSSKLRENIGASLIIKYVTEELWKRFTAEKNEVYSGGGNSYFKFDTKEEARSFIKKMSLEVLKNYEGLEFYGAFIEGEFSKEKMGELKEKLAIKKLERRGSFKKISFGIEEICKSTSTPASKIITDTKEKSNKRSVSQEAWRKNDFFDYLKGKTEGNEELKFLNDLRKNREYKIFFKEDYPLDLDEFGDKNSYLALVNIDGNRMGEMVGKVLEEEDLKKNLKEFSDFIKTSYEDAFDGVIKYMEGKKEGEKILIRPLVLAGDDLTYIIDSRYALESVKIFTEILEGFKSELMKKLSLGKLTIGAGVVFANKKTPFNKLYNLAEELCKSAKMDRIEGSSTIDWHILKGEVEEVDEFRRKMNSKFKTSEGEKSLFMRPLRILDIDNCEKLSLECLLKVVESILKNSDIRLGKLNELYGKFPNGREKVEDFILIHNLSESIEIINKELKIEGNRAFNKGKYHIFDVLELCNEKFYRGVTEDE